MSRPDRPFRSTHVMGVRTVHYDYATKEERARSGSSEISLGYHFTTVTSRKPLKPGMPVCWVNVYADGYPASHRTKEFADGAATGLNRLHCIPVYLPGEGAEPVTEQMREAAVSYYMQGVKDRQRIGELEAEVERLTGMLVKCGKGAAKLKEERDAALAEVEQWKDAAEVERLKEDLAKTLIEARGADAEVERLTKERDIAIRVQSDMITDRNHWREIAEGVGRERDAAQSKLAAAQAQAMPAGKVVYGARRALPGLGKYERVEVNEEGWRSERFPKSEGWTWFTRVEES